MQKNKLRQIRAGKKAAETRRKNLEKAGKHEYLIHYYGRSGKHFTQRVWATSKVDAKKIARRKNLPNIFDVDKF